MKLFTKYNRVNISATILTFLLGGVAFYFVLNYVLVRQLDRSLHVEQQEFAEYVAKNNHLPDVPDTRHQWFEVKPATGAIDHPRPFSIDAYNKIENETEPVRRLTFTVDVAGRLYQVTVSESKTETEDLLQLIILITLLMIALIVLANYLVNRKLINNLWRPFYRTIDNIRDYQVSGREPLHLPREEINEMDLLNESVNSMTERIHQDYLSLKSFTENASHEMQTPLAVIHSKTEQLLQLADGKEAMIQQILAIEDTTVKLARLNKSLLLLAKLGNRQFIPDESVNLSEVLRRKIEETADLVNGKQLTLITGISEVVLLFHHHLADILVSNLLTNAIRHTPAGGRIEVTLNQKELVVRNTTAAAPLDGTKIFQRFYKGDQSQESAGVGLGLAIVREICIVSGFSVGYRFEKEMHEFTVWFT